MTNLYKLSEVSRIFIIFAFCRLSTAQMLYVGDFCDFAGYEGTCLEASKCSELQGIMQALAFQSHQVGRCGFEVREEIICCPKWPKPVQTPPKLSNEFIDLSKRPEFEYRPPPDVMFNSSSIPITTSTPITFNQNGNNIQELVQNEDKRLKAIFNGNPSKLGSGNSIVDWNGDSAPAIDGNNNGPFNANPVPNIQDNQKINGYPFPDENERIKAIFGDNPVQAANDNSKDERKEHPIPVFNGNNNGFFNTNPVPNIQDNQKMNGNPVFDENERIKAIFGDNPVQARNDNSKDEAKEYPTSIVNENNDGFFNVNPVPNEQNNQKLNGNSIFDENERLKAIFNGNHIKEHVQDEDEILKAIFNGNPSQAGSGNIIGDWNRDSDPAINENNNTLFNANPVPNIQDNQKMNGNPVFDENERIKAIFGDNPVQAANDNSKDEKKEHPIPFVNGNNNGFFNVNSVPNGPGNQKLNGNPMNDAKERLRAIFNANFGQDGSGNIVEDINRNSVPVANGSNNDFFSANPMANVQENQKINSNHIYDENERLKAIFKGNPLPNVNDKDRRNGVTPQNPDESENLKDRLNAIFGGNLLQVGKVISKEKRQGTPVPFVDENSNGVFSANPEPYVNDNLKLEGNPFFDKNIRFNAIFSGDQRKVESVKNIGGWKENPVPVQSGNNNGFFNVNPVPNVRDNRKLNGNPVHDENERLKSIFHDNPLSTWNDEGGPNGRFSAIFGGKHVQLEGGNNSGVLGGKSISIEDENIYDKTMNGTIVQDEKAIINAILNGNLNRFDNGALEGNPSHPIFNYKPLRARHPKERSHDIFMESRISLDNRHSNTRNHKRFEEAEVPRRNQEFHRGFSRNKSRPKSTQNTRIRFPTN